jgi:hypothetical protein
VSTLFKRNNFVILINDEVNLGGIRMERDYNSIMNYNEFDDMKKYNPNFSEDQVKDKSDEEIRTMFKEWYSEHLPVDLLTWMRVYEPKNKMCCKQAYWNQTVFVRDDINRMFYSTYEDYKANPVKVISTHVSKSIVLPVYYIYLKKYNTKIIMRNNFYDWKISIDSEQSITGIDEFFGEDTPIASVYCEGFEESWVYGMYKENNKHFTIELRNNSYIVYTFFYMLKKSLEKR